MDSAPPDGHSRIDAAQPDPLVRTSDGTPNQISRHYECPTFMIVPSMACQASCRYCFGPHKGAVMNEAVAAATVGFIRTVATDTATDEVSIVFHGGEPLLAPIRVWRVLLDGIRTQLSGFNTHLTLQSNLWNLTDEMLALLRQNDVAIGTSMDGPQEWCDVNRGEGYFDKTMTSVHKATAAGCTVSAIATITKQTLPHAKEIASYFRDLGMPLVLHGAVDGLGNKGSPFTLTADEYADMVEGLFPWYVHNEKNMRLDTFDHFVSGVVNGDPRVCTLRDCFGMFLAISPIGDITSCQRLTGQDEFKLGSVFGNPTLKELFASPAARRQLDRETACAKRCADCQFYAICKGGCYYNALASGDGIIDSWCPAYERIFNFVQTKVLEEMQSPANLTAVASRPAEPGEHPLLREGAYIALAGKPHPSQIADNARRILAIHELGVTPDSATAARHLCDEGICGEPALTKKLIDAMRHQVHRATSRNNCYAHVTFDCNLRCTHCYAEGGARQDEMPMASFERLADETIEQSFRQLVITGGEPLVHSQRARLLEICQARKGEGTNLVLRTNLTGHFCEDDLAALAVAFDQVVVSVDGNEQTHNARRGAGTYANLTDNLEHYAEVADATPGSAELSLACVMSANDINGDPGQSVARLGERLHVKRVRFRPLLPLGRAAHLDEPVMCEGLMQHVRPEEMLKTQWRPLTTCGIGQNLFVKPGGGAYPCYAWCDDHTLIGNVFADGLATVLASAGFARLLACSVDTIDKCRDCEFRYLCGGACRAWGNQTVLDVNAAPPQCDHLKTRAQSLINAATDYVLGKVVLA